MTSSNQTQALDRKATSFGPIRGQTWMGGRSPPAVRFARRTKFWGEGQAGQAGGGGGRWPCWGGSSAGHFGKETGGHPPPGCCTPPPDVENDLTRKIYVGVKSQQSLPRLFIVAKVPCSFQFCCFLGKFRTIANVWRLGRKKRMFQSYFCQ